jgi:hypothetical protein
MKAREALKLVVGSLVVYGIVVACGTAGNQGFPSPGSGSGSASSGSPSGSTMSDAMAASEGSDAVRDATSSGQAIGDGAVVRILDALTDPVTTAKADTQSGSRLKAKWYVGADGSRQLAGWHDSQLKIDCTFTTASDGVIRCLPAFGVSAAYYAPTPAVFADAACTQEAAYQSVVSGCPGVPPSPSYAWSPDSAPSECSDGYAIYQIGSPLMVTYTRQTNYQDGGVTCVPSAATPTLAWYSVGAAVDPATFVSATVQTDP